MSRKVLVINYILLSCLFILNIFASVYFFTANNTENIFNDNIMKVVEVKVSDDELTWGYATGCFIDNNGTILTNKHVAFKSTTQTNYNIIQVRLADIDEQIDATVIRVSENDDLALIKINKQKTDYFKFGANIFNGDTIYTIGNPNGFGLSFTMGVVSSRLRKIIYNEQTIETIQTSFVINEGNSGGPVFTKNGTLVGLISFRLKDKNNDVIQGVSFAIPINKIIEFINL